MYSIVSVNHNIVQFTGLHGTLGLEMNDWLIDWCKSIDFKLCITGCLEIKGRRRSVAGEKWSHVINVPLVTTSTYVHAAPLNVHHMGNNYTVFPCFYISLLSMSLHVSLKKHLCLVFVFPVLLVLFHWGLLSFSKVRPDCVCSALNINTISKML